MRGRIILSQQTAGRLAASVGGAGKLNLAAGTACGAWFVYFLFATTNGFDWLSTWHNEQRAVQVVLLAVTALVATFCVRRFLRDVRLPGLSGALTCFLALGLLSASTARFPAHALADVALIIVLAAFVIVVWVAVSRFPVALVSWACVGLAAAHVTGVLTRYLTAISLSQPLGIDVLLLGYANPRFPSAFYALLIPFLASTAIATHKRRSIRAVAFGLLCALWTVNLALATRAIFFAYVVAAPIFVALVGPRKARPILWAHAASFILGLLLYWLMFVLVPISLGLSTADVVRSQADLSGGSGRLSLWHAATALIVANPILGVGPMHFAAISNPSGAHPHNSILQFASEYGLPATLALAYLAWGLFRVSASEIRRQSSDATRNSVPALLAVLVAAIYGLVDGNYLMPVSQSAIAICVGVLLAGTFPCKVVATQVFQGSPWPSRIVGAVVAVSGIYLSTYAVATIADGTPVPGAYSLPRFWEQGLINRPAVDRPR